MPPSKTPCYWPVCVCEFIETRLYLASKFQHALCWVPTAHRVHFTQLKTRQAGFDKFTHTVPFTRRTHKCFKGTVVSYAFSPFNYCSFFRTFPLKNDKKDKCEDYKPFLSLNWFMKFSPGFIWFVNSLRDYCSTPTLDHSWFPDILTLGLTFSTPSQPWVREWIKGIEFLEQIQIF